jgi:hypothetical protein
VNTIEPIPWRGFRAVDKLLFIVLPLLAVAVIALPILDQFFLRRVARLTGARSLVNWLAAGGTWVAAAGILLALALFVLWRRRRLVNDRALWAGTGCPECAEVELVRVSRHFSDRFYNLAAVPAYRYACRNCTWRGLRIARREHSLEHEAELEAALLRFDPHSPTATGDTMAARPQPAAYRDTGDANWEANATPAYANGTADESDEALEEMEWIWPRPTGTDQL